MKAKSILKICLIFGAIIVGCHSCNNGKEKKILDSTAYKTFKDSVIIIKDTATSVDTSNLFDNNEFIPGVDSLDTLLMQMDTLLHKEFLISENIDTLLKYWKKKDTFTVEEKLHLAENIKILDSFLINKKSPDSIYCEGKDCLIYAEINKQTQQLLLYIDGELVDTFLVSTGFGKYETPNLNLKPTGPVFTKYTSKKFPGGNYQGLGNMPYAVFVKGGYAIHGTTVGNFSKLGKKASHGCIRLHPTNAKIFSELVKKVGVADTWVTVIDSIPN